MAHSRSLMATVVMVKNRSVLCTLNGVHGTLARSVFVCHAIEFIETSLFTRQIKQLASDEG
jgi:hypothetical protein